MATTVAGAFHQFKANLEISSLQESTTSTRQQNVRDAGPEVWWPGAEMKLCAKQGSHPRSISL